MADLPGRTFRSGLNEISLAIDRTDCVRRTVTCISCSRIESIPHAAHVEQEPWLGRIGLQLAAEADDVVVDDAIADGDALAPDGVEQLLACEQAATTLTNAVSSLNSSALTSTGRPPRRTSPRPKSTSTSPNGTRPAPPPPCGAAPP